MNKPIIDLSKDWQQPTSIKEDKAFAGHPWKVFTIGRLIKSRRSELAGNSYFKIPASIVSEANIVAIYKGQAMLLAHGQLPADTMPASFKNPKTYNLYRWIPSLHHHDGHWLSLTDYVRAVMPEHREPAPVTPVSKTQEYWENRRRLAEADESAAVRYLCTCGARHAQTIYKALGDRPWERCPGGGIMRRVLDEPPAEVKLKYVCDCRKNHTRTTVPSQKPDRCPDGGNMVEAA